jgi:1A family penicillin-binding protein
MAHRRYARKQSLRLRGLTLVISRRWLQLSLTVGGILFLISAATVLWWSKDLPNPQNLNSRQVLESTKIYDHTGEHLLYEIGDVHRTVVTLDRISNYVRQATLAAEDDQFYDHHGLDFKGILRGTILKPLSGQRAQGGSTITQQLIKNSILTPERTIRRKVKEGVLALELEQRFTKDQILEMYLNQIPYGSQAHGIEAAAQTFFHKSAADVSIAEAAALAALPQAPTYYSPYGSHFEDLKGRQEYVLGRMVSLKMITQEQADAARQETLTFAPRRESIAAPHFVFYVKELLNEEFGESVVEQGGLKIITTLDVELQKIAEEVLTEQQAQLQKMGASNAALVALDPKTGNILAMVGSVDYFNEEIDGNVNVSIRHRSPGSSIKPFVYATAFQRGYTPETILVDAETDFGQNYRPRNYTLKEYGPVTMRTALANSLNIPAVQTLYLAGVKEATTLAQKMGMTSLNDPDRYGLSLVLGGGEVRLVDEVSAYGVFANDGVRLPHRALLRVSTAQGEIFNAEDPDVVQQPEEVIKPQISRQITSILADNGARAFIFGTNNYLHLGSRPVAAKTGTTQEFRDAWTMGYTPSLATGVWVGNNDNSPMSNRSDGSVVAAPIWNAFMRRALTGKPIEQFVKPAPSTNIPHPILRGELPEVKGKWDPETNQVYTLECPVAIGQPKTFKEVHNILFYVRRTDPLGSSPTTAESDPQFARWEAAVAAWRDRHNTETKDKPEEPHYGASLPEPTCGISDSSELPQIRIVEPNTTIIKGSPVRIKIEIESEHPLAGVRFLLDGQEIGRGNGDLRDAAFSFPNDFSGRKALLVLATTDNKLVGRAHRTFIINPDESSPTITLHAPRQGLVLKAKDFPFTAKATATDPNGIEAVDFLYRKEGREGTQRLGRSTTTVPTAPNRYEAIWKDSPGPGTYTVYAIAYDTTGNFTQTPDQVITIED